MTSKLSKEVIAKLEKAQTQLKSIQEQLVDPAALDGIKRKELYKENSDLSPIVNLFEEWKTANQSVADAKELFNDEELKSLAEEELQKAENNLNDIEDSLIVELQPKDPDDDKNCFVEIRAGTGGLESCIFSGDLLRMYTRWAEEHKLKIEVISTSPGDAGGYKEIIVKMMGKNSMALFKHEAGAHRVQRVPETESQGRIHTSVCTVAVMPEVNFQDVDIDQSELRIDTYRSSGAGGQHVNTTDSAVRVTHLPTGIVAESQNDRSQHRNKERAMSMLVARVNNHFRKMHESKTEGERREMVGTGERNEKIRTYNFPQSRVTDHRVNLTIRRLKEIMDGDLRELYEALRQDEKARQIESGIAIS